MLNKTCKKCGSADATVKFVREVSHEKALKAAREWNSYSPLPSRPPSRLMEPEISEHLKLSCSCGFEWQQPCIDTEVKPTS